MKIATLMFLAFLSTGFAKPVQPLITPNTQNSRIIPLDSIVSTSSQGGLQNTSLVHRGDGDHKSYEGYLEQIVARGGGDIASNVFLADTPDIDGAVAAAFTVISGGRSTDIVATLNQSNPPRGNNWLVAYLGIGSSSGPPFIVDEVTVNDATIRLVYHKPKLMSQTDDIHQYFYWVPLGKLNNGTYFLELFDFDSKEVMLTRRVVVRKN